MSKVIRAVRGAICTQNDKDSIIKDVCALCNKIFYDNKVKAEDIVSVQFTLTKDITAFNPAAALRAGKVCINTSDLSLFCACEPFIQGSLEKVVRVMITCYMEDTQKLCHIYLNGAQVLRPDFVKNS